MLFEPGGFLRNAHMEEFMNKTVLVATQDGRILIVSVLFDGVVGKIASALV